MRVLVAGIAGKLGRLTALRLAAAGHEVEGLDRRPWRDAPREVRVHALDVRKRPAEDVFRRFRPEAVVHLATVAQLSLRTEDQLRQNLAGTRAVFDAAHRHGASRVVFVGRHTYYGAAPDSPLYHTEDEPPVEVGSLPQLADLVAADLYAASAFWRFPGMRVAILRVAYALGPSRRGLLASYLSLPRVPTVLGYDPLVQVVHEEDAAEAVALAAEKGLHGVFNVAGPPPLPLSKVISAAGRKALPLPAPLLRLGLARVGLAPLPGLAAAHLQYPVVVDDRPFRRATGFEPRYDALATVESFRHGV